MKNKIVSTFEELCSKDVKIAGGKGASLGEMTNAKIPVPPGFVILADAFDKFIKETDLNVEIDAALDEVNIKEVHTVENASKTIQAMVLSKEIPEDIKKEILENYKKLDSKFIAVRSSATSEDSASAAWAGQLDSFLNTTKETLLKNVKQCWASLFTPRAIFYRFEKKLHKDKISVAVVVQKMVNSEDSGIAFSVHPVTEDKNQIIIEAGFGLGEAIVSGSITPDSYVVDKQGFNILDINVNKQTKGLYKKINGGNQWKELREKGKKQVLSEKEIIELSKLIVKIENHYGFPCDIEWAKEKGKFYIVQSRPITTLKNNFKKENYKNYNLEFLFKEYKTTFFRDYSVVDLFIKQAHIYNIPRLHFGIITEGDEMSYFANISSWGRAYKKITKDLKKDLSYLPKILNNIYKKSNNLVKNSFKNIYSVDLTKLNNFELEKLYFNFLKENTELFAHGLMLSVIEYTKFNFVEDNLKKIIKKRIKSKNIFLEHLEAFTVYHKKSIIGKEEEDLLNLMAQHDSNSFNIDVKHKSFSYVKNKYKSFYKQLKKHTQKYGWAFYLFRGPAYKEKDFFDLIKANLSRNIDPIKELKKNKKISKHARQLRIEFINKYKLTAFEKMILEQTGRLAFLKVFRKDAQTKGYFYFEKLLTEISSRLSIKLKDVWLIPPYVLASYLKGEKKVDKKMISRLSNCYAIFPDDEENIHILEGSEAKSYLNHFANSHKDKTNLSTEIKGNVAYKGQVTGLVKIINKPSDMKKMRDGDILVSISTSPLIVPAMKKATAFITDQGGLASHAAIIAREMKVPCVVGTENATLILRDGDEIDVDANNGIIKIMKKAKQ